jgi:hypothetical protein
MFSFFTSQKQELLEASVSNRIYNIPLRIIWYVLLSLLLTNLLLLLGSLGTRKWLKQGKEENAWQGSLLHVTEGPNDWENETYDQLADDYCDMHGEDNEALCILFKNLHDAGATYVSFGVMNVICTIGWILKIVFLLLEKKCCNNLIGYILSGICGLFQLIGLVVWSAVSESKYNADCDKVVEKGETGELCNTDGPALALTVMLMYVVITPAFVYVYMKRYDGGSSTLTNVKQAEMAGMPSSFPKSLPRISYDNQI